MNLSIINFMESTNKDRSATEQPKTPHQKPKRPTKEEIQALKKAHWEEFMKSKQQNTETELGQIEDPYDTEDTALPSFPGTN